MQNRPIWGVITLSLILMGCGAGDELAEPEKTTNHSPVLASVTPQITFSGSSKTITLIANDEDGDGLTFNAASSDSRLTIEMYETNLILTPETGFHGVVDVTVSASDGSQTDNISFTIRVLQISTPPTPTLVLSQLSLPPIPTL